MMSAPLAFLVLLAAGNSQARENLFRAKEAPSMEKPADKTSVPPIQKNKAAPLAHGNLAQAKSEAAISPGGQGGVITPKGLIKHPSLKPGMHLVVEIEHTVISFAESKTPVIAKILSRGFEGLILIGEASLEPNSKNTVIVFNSLSSQSENQVFHLKGTAQAQGEYHTNSDKLFVAEFLSAAAAGFVESSVQRDQGVLGNYIEKPSVENHARRGVGEALGKSSERFKERVRSAREFSVLRPTIIQALVLE